MRRQRGGVTTYETATAVIVTAPAHPQNDRWVARPSVVTLPSSAGRELPEARHLVRVVFREDGIVSEVTLLRSDRALAAEAIAALTRHLRESVQVRHAGERRHVAVGYLAVRSSSEGLALEHQRVVLPLCFCWPE